MKNIQTGILKILKVLVLVFGVTNGYTQTPFELLQKADSLYAKKQFTQSFEIYQRIHSSGQYSSAMLLKMAFIQEGLNKPGLALYYLNLYYLANGDAQTLVKMEELAAKNNLPGYEYSQVAHARELITRYRPHAALAIASVILLLVAVSVYQSRAGTRPVVAGILTLLGLVFLGVLVNFSSPGRTAIITGNNTFVMNGPSAGASVVGLLNEGSKVQITGTKDVWLKVSWADRDAYIKQAQVMEVKL
ncbi:MAG: hypothetical protein KIT62_03425 [Cyclobacteriaceae bacterium]|nr:hypothetical protein [Cyclobacteriaceae bacterium]